MGILCTVDVHDNIALVGWVKPVPAASSLHHAGGGGVLGSCMGRPFYLVAMVSVHNTSCELVV